MSVTDDAASQLYQLADLIHGVARQLRPPADLAPGECTPVEIIVMRFIHQNPGTASGAASEATLLPSSNFSRVLRGLEGKGLLRRESDARDGRGVRLYPTPLSDENFQRMRETWSRQLDGLADDSVAVDSINAALRRIEAGLIARRARAGDGNA